MLFRSVSQSRYYTTPPTTSITFVNLEPNTTYTTTATPISTNGTQLPPIIFPAVTTADPPKPPTHVIFCQKNSSQLEVTWIPVATVAAADDAPKWYVLRSTDDVIALTIDNWRTSYVTPPLPGGTFRFNLYAVNDAGYSAPVTSEEAYNFI